MFDYKNYGIKEFLNDESFQRWILHNTGEDRLFWEKWLSGNPGREIEIIQARKILLAIRNNIDIIHEGNTIQVNDEEINLELSKLWGTVNRKNSSVIPLYKTAWFKAAASVLLIIGLGYLLFVSRQHNSREIAVPIAGSSVGEKQPVFVEIINKANDFQLAMLPDGSSVLLKKGSKIKYSQQFHDKKREVYLAGEAFFEVSKDASRPFFVYTNDIVARVIGTSFTICAYEGSKQTKVIVKTGKVRVFSNNDIKTKKYFIEKENDGLLLTPNRQIVFNSKDGEMISSNVSLPDIQEFSIQRQSFTFERTPLSQVFATLEKTYGVTIAADSKTVNGRCLTTALSDEPLLKKMDMICKIFDLCYEKNDNNVVVKKCISGN